MPHLTRPLSKEGCEVTLFVNVSIPRRQALQAAGLPIPLFVAVPALIDTGASCTAIDADSLTPLGLVATGISHVITPSTGGQPAPMPQYDVVLGLDHPSSPLLIEVPPIIAIPNFTHGNIRALIGRDVLGSCLFIYNGPEGNFTIAF